MIVFQLEERVSICFLVRVLAALAFRGLGNLVAFRSSQILRNERRTIPLRPTYHSNVMFFEPSILCLREMK